MDSYNPDKDSGHITNKSIILRNLDSMDYARGHWGVSGFSPGPTPMLIFIVGYCSHVYCYHLCDWSVNRDLPNSWSIGHFEFRR